MFQVDVGTDLFGSKVNKRLEFIVRPTLQELLERVTAAFETEGRLSRPVGVPDLPFRVETIQIYDDILRRWVDLYSASQLYHGVQLFCFQPASPWHNDEPGDLPPPTSSHWAEMPRMTPALSEKLRSVFFRFDKGKGYCTYSDLIDAFQDSGMLWSHATVGDYFNVADTNRNGRITYDEWVDFAMRYPHIIDGLYSGSGVAVSRSISNSSALGHDKAFYGSLYDSASQVKAAREREDELRRLYNRATEDRQRAERAAAALGRTF